MIWVEQVTTISSHKSIYECSNIKYLRGVNRPQWILWQWQAKRVSSIFSVFCRLNEGTASWRQCQCPVLSMMQFVCINACACAWLVKNCLLLMLPEGLCIRNEDCLHLNMAGLMWLPSKKPATPFAICICESTCRNKELHYGKLHTLKFSNSFPSFSLQMSCDIHSS